MVINNMKKFHFPRILALLQSQITQKEYLKVIYSFRVTVIEILSSDIADKGKFTLIEQLSEPYKIRDLNVWAIDSWGR